MMIAKKTSTLLLLLSGICTLALLVIMWPGKLAQATEPTPTPLPTPIAPQSDPLDPLCRLAWGQDCILVGPLDKNIPNKWTNPAMDDQDVPTYTLISAAFDREMDAASFTSETFYVIQADGRHVTGSLSYIEASKIAIFSPDAPLQPGATYIATVSPVVRESSGAPLGERRTWSFTTRSAALPGTVDIAATDLLAQNGMSTYLGDLHNHTGYSDGVETPAQAFAVARASGLNFFAVTEHDFMMTPEEWADLKYQANQATILGQFVALSGFEYTNQYGHLNVFNSDDYIRHDDPNYDTLAEFYDWLIAQPTAFAQFNHPRKQPDLDWNFNNFEYNPQADLKIVLQELQTVDQFLLCLNKGWHVGSLAGHDTHSSNWGCCPWMGVVASGLTKEAIIQALLSRRTFFVSPSDSNSNFALVMQANGYWMGSAIPNTGVINFTINAYDPDPRGKLLHLILYDNGIQIASTTLFSNTIYTWNPTAAGQWGHYYYAEAYYEGWLYPAYSSPIWVEYPPLAEAGPGRFVAPEASVILDGRLSADPDGDAVAYHWTQNDGPAGILNNVTNARLTFTAPVTLGEAIVQLTVTDPGGLSDVDTTTVTITNAPILAISKSGPNQTEPGELITYTLTVTNEGIDPANNLVITDVVPVGAVYISGGTLLPDNIVSWTIADSLTGGETVQVSFVVTATRPLVNFAYGAACPDCIPATGDVAIYTNRDKVYLPLIRK